MLNKLTYNFPEKFSLWWNFYYYTNEPYVNDVTFMNDSVNISLTCILRILNVFLNAFASWILKKKKNLKKREQLTNKRKKNNAPWQVDYFEWSWNMLVLSVTWMFMPHWNLIHGCCNLNRFSNTFPASLFQSLSCSFAFFPCVVNCGSFV